MEIRPQAVSERQIREEVTLEENKRIVTAAVMTL